MRKLTGTKAVAAILLGALFGGQVLAAEWTPIKREDVTVREVDSASIKRNGPVVTFTSRHTFADRNEYKVSRHEAQYLVIHSRANCAFRTMAQLATEAYDEKMGLISKQQIQRPQDLPVTAESIDESVLNLVCTGAQKSAH